MPYRAFVGLWANRSRVLNLGAAESFLGCRAAHPFTEPDHGIAEAIAGDDRDVLAVLGEWETWRGDRLKYDSGGR